MTKKFYLLGKLDGSVEQLLDMGALMYIEGMCEQDTHSKAIMLGIAEACYLSVLEIKHECPEALQGLADVYHARGEYAESARALLLAEKADWKDLNVHFNMAALFVMVCEMGYAKKYIRRMKNDLVLCEDIADREGTEGDIRELETIIRRHKELPVFNNVVSDETAAFTPTYTCEFKYL